MQTHLEQTTLQLTDPNVTSIRSLASELVRLSLVEDNPTTRQSILRQVGLLINKFLPLEDVHYPIDILKNLLAGSLERSILPENTVRASFWISKALVLRLVNTNEVLELLLELLSNRSYGLACARGFGLLLAPDEILSKENGATIRLLAKQKVFNICVPIITKEFRGAETSLKSNYLIALSGILKYMSTEVMMSEIEVILPLLLQSLDLEDSDVKAATIQNIMVVSQDSPKAVEGHMGSLVTRLLKSAMHPTVNSTGVRRNALRCLRLFPGSVKDSNLLPYRNVVIRGLMTALDDSKRNVRKEAVECRAAWFNLDEPQSD